MRQNNFPNNYNIPVNTPNYFGHRGRLLSINTPKLSPLRMVQSPFPILTQPNFFQNQLGMVNEFHLQEAQPAEDYAERVNQSDDESYSELEFPKFPQNEEVNKDNLIDFLVATINIDEERIQRVRQQMQSSGQTFLAEVFQYLYKRFKKTKKTKQEMIKYTMRKSFKFIIDEMKKEDPSLVPLLTADGVEGMSIYFTKHSEDKQISIPFKKNSVQKTMNTAFLKGVFSVEQFAKDYKRFLKTFQNEFLKDNKKKINSMTDAVKACISTKNYKSLQNYKRIPWTTDILTKLKSFAADLLNYSPHKGAVNDQHSTKSKQRGQKEIYKISLKNIQQNIKPRKTSFQLNSDFFKQEAQNHRRSESEDHLRDFIHNEDEDEHEDLIHELRSQEKKVKKKSVIILTPPMIPLSDPPKLPEDLPLE